jgi:hypothetical protein
MASISATSCFGRGTAFFFFQQLHEQLFFILQLVPFGGLKLRSHSSKPFDDFYHFFAACSLLWRMAVSRRGTALFFQ